MVIIFQMFRLNQMQTNNQSSCSTPLLYDPFLFVDSLTNRSIPVKNIRDKSLLTRSHRHTKTLGFQEEEIRQLDQCINFLKSTMTFRKNALRQKLFGDVNKKQERLSQQSELVRKKRLIRQLVSQQIEQKNRVEFEKYLCEPNHQLDLNLVKVAKNNNFLISKKTISKIVNTLQKKQNHTMQPIKRKYEQNDQAFILKMNNIENQINSEVREKLRKSGQFLVDPQHHFVQAKSFTPLKFKMGFEKKLEENRHVIKKMKWHPNTISKQNLKHQRQVNIRNQKTTNKHQSQILSLVANGQVQDVQIFAQKHTKKQNLKARDNKGNTLFHIAVLNNKILTFEWLLRKLGVSSLLLKNQDGQTAPDIAVRLDRREILAYIPQSMI